MSVSPLVYISVDQYKLTLRERYTIEILLKEGLKPIKIAKRLERHKRTIEREIARGTVKLLNNEGQLKS